MKRKEHEYGLVAQQGNASFYECPECGRRKLAVGVDIEERLVAVAGNAHVTHVYLGKRFDALANEKTSRL